MALTSLKQTQASGKKNKTKKEGETIMEVKVTIDLSDRTISTIEKLVDALAGARVVYNLSAKAVKTDEATAETEADEKSTKTATKTTKATKSTKPTTKQVEEAEAEEEDVEVDEATLRAKVSEGSAAGLKDEIKAFLKENFKTVKIGDLDPEDYIKVYKAVDEMLKG